MLVTTLLTSILETLHVAAFFPVFQSLLQTSAGGTQGRLLGAITSASGFLPFPDPLVGAVIVLIGIAVLRFCMTLLRESLVAHASGTVQHDVKNRIVRCYADAPYQFFLDKKQGKLNYDALIAASRVGILMHRVPQSIAELLKVITIGALLLMILPVGVLVLVVVGLAYNGLTHCLSKRVSYHTGKGRAISGAEQTVILQEFLSGIRQIVTFGTQAAWLERFRHQSLVFRGLYVKDSIWLTVPKSLMELTAVVIVLVFIVVSRVATPGALTENLPVAGVFALALFQILPSMTSFGRYRMEAVGLMADAELAYQTLTGHTPRRLGGQRTFEGLQRGIVFDRVSFAYPDRPTLLKGLDVAFERGKVTAIVGPSGSGKTTIVNLILGLFEPTEGRMLVDDVDFREYRAESWLRRIGFVSQDPFIYHASIAENITFGRDGHSVQSVQRAAEIANAHDFVSALPRQYDTVVGDRGMKLSGGQQQRIAIARAVLDDPDILIFDEATSSLDTVSEKLVQDAIEKISRQRTVVIIAHRPSTIRNADKIVVLDEGRIVEEGSHQQLLDEHGTYSQLVGSASE